MRQAINYKGNGYKYVLILHENDLYPYIWKGFKSYKAMITFRDKMQLGEERICKFITVNKAIRLGY